MAILFRPLLTALKSKGLTKTALKTQKIVGGGTYSIIAKAISTPLKEGISISTIDDICAALDCQPGDIMEYVPDEDAKKSGTS